MNLPTSTSDLIRANAFSSELNSEANLSSLSLSINDFIAEKLKEALSLTGDEPLDEAIKSFIDFTLFPALAGDQFARLTCSIAQRQVLQPPPLPQSVPKNLN